MIEMSARAVFAGYRAKTVLNGVDIDVRAGQVHGLIGPNGAGKSTLLRVLGAILPRSGGEVSTPHGDIAEIDAKVRANHVAFLPQDTSAKSDLTVRRVVELGRFIHQSRWQRLKGEVDPASAEIIETSLARVGALHLADRPITKLSGGQRQLVLIAKQLAQQSRVLMLDEPVSALDLGFQLEVLALVRELAAEGHAVVVVLHDLNLAARSCDTLTVMAQGRVVASGSPSSVLTASLIGDLYGVDVVVEHDRHTSSPRITALARRAHHDPHECLGGLTDCEERSS